MLFKVYLDDNLLQNVIALDTQCGYIKVNEHGNLKTLHGRVRVWMSNAGRETVEGVSKFIEESNDKTC